MTLPEVRRLLLALAEPPERFAVRLHWSSFRRRHQAVAQRCHAQRLYHPDGSPPIQVLPAGPVELTDVAWARIAALLPPWVAIGAPG